MLVCLIQLLLFAGICWNDDAAAVVEADRSTLACICMGLAGLSLAYVLARYNITVLHSSFLPNYHQNREIHFSLSQLF